MAFDKPLISIKDIVLSLQRRIGQSLDSNYYEDIMVWIEEGLSLIQCYGMLVTKEATIALKNRRGKLPCHFELIVGVASKDRRLYVANNQVDFRNSVYNQANSYRIDGNEIVIGDECIEEVTFFYKDFMRDKEGFMMIPAHAHIREYLIFFAMMNLSGTGYPHIKLSYEKLEQKVMRYEILAMEQLRLPTLEDLENFKNSIFTILPLSTKSYNTFFNGTEEGTSLITHYNDMD